ncbi:MAG: hypothetical protein KatS3mg027_0909 [Bacteroidia bacterium]|nr:MAG: hypothetical protein KatS3mg027_0909 [Bacteroidia bacterium]
MGKKISSKKSSAKRTTKKSGKKVSAKKSVKKSSKKASKKTTTKKSTKKSVAKKSVKNAAKKVSKKATTKSSKKSVKKITKKATVKVSKKTISRKEKQKTKASTSQTTQQSSVKFTPHITSLKPGMPAPYFEGIDQDGNKVTLNDLAGSKFVLYFYPKDDTPGCTKEACNIRDNYQRFLDAGYTVFGVSADSVESHKKFKEKYNLPFSLISDPEKNIIRAYDVWGKKQFMGKISEGLVRTTFVIDENGVISNVITKVEVDNHTEQILRSTNE